VKQRPRKAEGNRTSALLPLGVQGILSEILDFVMGTGLIPADGEIWRVRRRAIVPALHRKVSPGPKPTGTPRLSQTQEAPLASMPHCCHLQLTQETRSQYPKHVLGPGEKEC